MLSVSAGKNESMYAVCKLQFIKINEQSDRNIDQLEIAHELGLVDRQHLSDRLRLNQDAIFDQNIETERFLPSKSFIGNGYDLLANEGEPIQG
jgi:hypothetical protein